MTFYIETSTGSGCEYADKQHFFAELEAMVDDFIANGGTEFSVTVEADASYYIEEE